MWILHFGFGKCWEIVLEDYENNSKTVGYAPFSYSNFCKLLVFKKGFRNIYEYRMKQSGFNRICINMFRLFFRPADGIYIYGDIEGGFRVNHDYMVISVEHAGHDFVVQQGVTIAALKSGIRPSFGEDVYIGSNALILGECSIGSHVNIGAGAFILNQDIPDNCTVVGNPCRIIMHENNH